MINSPVSLELRSARTPHLIGRQEIVEKIRKAIRDDSNDSYSFYITSPGGIGKTRLLEEIAIVEQEEKNKFPFRWSGIIDLYHEEYHSPGRLQQAIAAKLDPDNRYFQKFRQIQEELEERKRQGAIGQLEGLRTKCDLAFQEAYGNKLAKEHRLVLSFDTVELIQYERDEVQRLVQIQDVQRELKNWLLQYTPHLPNTVILFAGRPRREMEAEFEDAFAQSMSHFEKFELKAFTPEEAKAYFQAMREELPHLEELLEPAEEDWLVEISEGRPIRLALTVDLLLSDILPPHQKEGIDKAFIQLLQTLRDEKGAIIYWLMRARKGLDTGLLQNLTGWSEVDVKQHLGQMREFAIIKPRPDSDILFLHDEIYDLYDRYFRNDPQFGSGYESIVQYYRKLGEESVTRLYYELQVNAYIGYYRYYAYWNEEAIKAHDRERDMRLRDEVLRFLNRYALQSSEFFDPRVIEPQGVNQKPLAIDAINRDFAVLWVKRHLARGKLDVARDVAEDLRYATDLLFKWDEIDDPLYKANLLTAWAEALLYLGAPESEIRPKLEEAIEHLEVAGDWDEDEQWWRARILGRAYNNLGFMHRLAHRQHTAVNYYLNALHYYRQADIKTEMADSLNNAAYAYALLGNISRAEKLGGDALALRRQLGQQYPLALSLNTRGLIHLLADEPHRARPLCEEALRIFRDTRDKRGILLGSHALGQTFRAMGNLWRRGVYNPDQAFEFYNQGRELLTEAVDVAQLIPEMHVLTLHEWAALERNQGILAKYVGRIEQADFHFTRALELLEESIERAGDRWLVEKVDCLEDRADVYVHKKQFTKAEDTILEAEALVPSEYYLVERQGFTEIKEPIDEFWVILGKLHLQRAHIALESTAWLTAPAEPEIESEEEDLMQAMTHYALAVAYFWKFSPESDLHKDTFREIYQRLKTCGLRRLQRMRDKVVVVGNTYAVDLGPLLKEIDETLALKPLV